MKEKLKELGLATLWLISWGVMVIGLGLATKLIYKLFMLGWSIM